MEYVANFTKNLARGNLNSQAGDLHISKNDKHLAYADSISVSISDSIIKELEGISNRLNIIINQHIIHKIV